MKTNLRIAYQNENIRVFKVSPGYIVEGVNRVYKRFSSAKKKADEINMQIILSEIFNH